MYIIQGKYTTALMTIDQYEESCVNQVNIMCSHPAFTNPIVIQPDGHAGKGSCVGFTMAMGTKIIPAVIGVDIGCGVLAVQLKSIDLNKLKKIDHEIKRSIPMGTNINKTCQLSPTQWNDLFNGATLVCEQFVLAYNKKFSTSWSPIKYDMDWFEKKIKQINIDPERAMNSPGSLGGGNHFLSIEKSETHEHCWLLIHTGSRKFGECVCKYHQNIAKKNLEYKRNVELQLGINAIMSEHRYDHTLIQPAIDKLKQDMGLDFGIDIKGMEYLEDEQAMDYFFDMIFAQQYAKMNRKLIAETIVLNAFKGQDILDTIDSVHNYIDFNDLIIRKGAIPSYTGVRSIIPLNMEDGSMIVEGKSNPEWNFSAPHGAGRLMSRTQAKEVLSLEDMKSGMKAAGVFSTSISKHTLDEAKGAYKSADMIESAIEPTAVIIERIRPILNIKDDSSDLSWKEKRRKH